MSPLLDLNSLKFCSQPKFNTLPNKQDAVHVIQNKSLTVNILSLSISAEDSPPVSNRKLFLWDFRGVPLQEMSFCKKCLSLYYENTHTHYPSLYLCYHVVEQRATSSLLHTCRARGFYVKKTLIQFCCFCPVPFTSKEIF